MYNDLVLQVMSWGREKGIVEKGNEWAQFNKTVEEVAEAQDCLLDYLETESEEDYYNLIMEIGDIEVTLILLKRILEIPYDEPLQMAYEKIKYRKGKAINGTFVKEEDLK